MRGLNGDALRCGRNPDDPTFRSCSCSCSMLRSDGTRGRTVPVQEDPVHRLCTEPAREIRARARARARAAPREKRVARGGRGQARIHDPRGRLDPGATKIGLQLRCLRHRCRLRQGDEEDFVVGRVPHPRQRREHAGHSRLAHAALAHDHRSPAHGPCPRGSGLCALTSPERSKVAQDLRMAMHASYSPASPSEDPAGPRPAASWAFEAAAGTAPSSTSGPPLALRACPTSLLANRASRLESAAPSEAGGVQKRSSAFRRRLQDRDPEGRRGGRRAETFFCVQGNGTVMRFVSRKTASPSSATVND